MSTSRFEIVVGGRVHTVHVEPADGPTRVRVRIDDGDVIVVDAAVVGSPNAATTWSIRDVATGIVSTAAVTLGSSGDGEAVVAGHAVPVALENRRRRARAARRSRCRFGRRWARRPSSAAAAAMTLSAS